MADISDATQNELHDLIAETKTELALLKRVSHVLSQDERIVLRHKLGTEAEAYLERIDHARDWLDASLTLRRDLLGCFFIALAERIAKDSGP